MGMGREVPIPAHVSAGCAFFNVDPHDVAKVAMGAAAWASGLPIEHNENLEPFRESVNRVLAAFGLDFDFDHFDGATA